jgi:hypothetical protein
MVKAVRANAAVWEARREYIESFSLKSQEHWDPYEHDDSYSHPVWKMDLVLKAGATGSWRHKKTERIAHTRDIVTSMGLSKPEVVDGRTVSSFRGLKLEASRIGEHGKEASRYGGMSYW